MDNYALNLSRHTMGKHAQARGENDGDFYLADITEAFSQAPDEIPNCVEIDLSFSALFDEDVEDIFNLVKILPRCSVVNLSGLFLYDNSVDAIRKIAGLEYVRYIIITSTPLASSACTRAYDVFTREDLTKIIFVSTDSWLAKKYWHNTVRDPEKQSVVVDTHTLFYKERPDIAKILYERTSMFDSQVCDSGVCDDEQCKRVLSA